jgi:hypothetical protein
MKSRILFSLILLVSSLCFSQSKADDVSIDLNTFQKEENKPLMHQNLDPNKEYIFGDSQVLYEDKSEKQFNIKEYLPLILVVVFFFGGFFLLRKFSSSAKNFTSPLKWLILVAWNLTLAVGIYESQRGTNLFPAMFWTSISTILSYGYLFGFKKKQS